MANVLQLFFFSCLLANAFLVNIFKVDIYLIFFNYGKYKQHLAQKV